MVPDRKILALGNVIKEGGGLDVVIRRRGFVVQDDDDGEAPFSKADGVPDSDPANRQNNHSIQNQTHSHHHIVGCWSKSLQVYISLLKNSHLPLIDFIQFRGKIASFKKL